MPVSFRRFAAAALVLASAACADSPTAPAIRPTTGGVDFSLIGTLVRGSGDTTITTFTVDPTSATTFQVGSGHIVYFPRNAICDLSSSYGVSEWDKPCTPATRPIAITAKTWVDAYGQPQVDFSPSMRFVPTQNSNGIVWIGMAIDRLSAATSIRSLNVLYCATPTATCVDESLTDPTLNTVVNLAQGYAARRIKHFSGYNVSSGRASDGMTLLSLSRASGSNGAAVDAESRTGHLMSSGRSDQQ